jgi:hypothetical protein
VYALLLAHSLNPGYNFMLQHLNVACRLQISHQRQAQQTPADQSQCSPIDSRGECKIAINGNLAPTNRNDGIGIKPASFSKAANSQ